MPLPMYPKKDPSQPARIKSVIGIAAGKGGVGKSTVTVNLARVLCRQGFRVGILDADLYGPSIRKMLPEDRFPLKKGGRFIPALCSGIAVMSLAYFRGEEEAAAVRAPIANGLISQFLQQVEWGNLDFLLIDFPPGTGDIQLTLAQQARLAGALMVTTPQSVSLMDVKKAMSLFAQVKVPVLGVVENMSYYTHAPSKERIHVFGQGGGTRLARESGVPFLGEIPLDPVVCASGDEGFPLDSEENSEAAQAFNLLAQNFLDHLRSIEVESAGSLGNFDLMWKEMPS